MRLYLHQGVWQVPGKQDRHAERVDIPTDTAGLCAWLNDREDSKYNPEPEPLTLSPDLGPPRYPDPKPDYTRDFTATEIEDFILNRASVAQVGNIFECLGTRFAEQRKVRAA